MKPTKYHSYKEVPIPWIASIPEHWDWKPVLGVASERDEKNKGMKENNLLSLSYGNIVNKDINTSEGLLPESFETYQIVRPGDIVLRLTDLQNDKRSLRSALVTQTGIITSAYLALKPDRIDSRYLGYLLRAYDIAKVFYSMGGGLRQSMKYGDIKRMPLVIPTKAEQIAITSFLDRETSKIDALIAEQERLIELLQEKRQAVISHAVTKGLNSDAPMKDSGVEWLGEVPQHWDVVQIKWLSPVKRGASPRPIQDSKYFDDCGEYAWVRISDVTSSNGRLETTSQRLSELGSSLSVKLKPGSLFVSIAGSVGKPCITRIKACIHDGFVYFPSLQINPEFLELIFISGDCFGGLGKLGTQLNLNTDTIGAIRVGMPTEEKEVNDIIEYCKQESERLGELETAALSAVTLLRERRSALISAAVTGQIDVRGLAPEEKAT